MNQVQFGGATGLEPSVVSRYEAGVMAPSVEALIKIGAFVARDDPAKALFFWNQTGLDSSLLFSLADAHLQVDPLSGTGNILLTAESILKERFDDQGRGGVLVPPFTEGVWRHQGAAPPLLVPAELVRNKASTYYLIAAMGSAQVAAGDRIVFDAAGASAQKFGLFQGQQVILRAKSPLLDQELGVSAVVLYIGTLDCYVQSGKAHIILGPRDRQRHDWVMKNREPADPALPTMVGMPLAGGALSVWPGWLLEGGEAIDPEKLSDLVIPKPWEIMGRFISLIAGGEPRK